MCYSVNVPVNSPTRCFWHRSPAVPTRCVSRQVQSRPSRRRCTSHATSSWSCSTATIRHHATGADDGDIKWKRWVPNNVWVTQPPKILLIARSEKWGVSASIIYFCRSLAISFLHIKQPAVCGRNYIVRSAWLISILSYQKL